jgi:hypothetical protein
MVNALKNKKNNLVFFVLEVLLLACMLLIKNNGILLVYYALLLLGLIPSIAIIEICSHKNYENRLSIQILKLNIICQTIVVLLPISVFFLSFIFINTRNTPQYLEVITFIIVSVSLLCIITSMISNIVYVIIQRSSFWSILVQIAYIVVAFYAFYLFGYFCI